MIHPVRTAMVVFALLPQLGCDSKKDEYERYFGLARNLVDPGGLIVADNVLSHEEALGAYSRARQSDPTLLSVTVPLDSGLELTTVLEP